MHGNNGAGMNLMSMQRNVAQVMDADENHVIQSEEKIKLENEHFKFKG